MADGGLTVRACADGGKSTGSRPPCYLGRVVSCQQGYATRSEGIIRILGFVLIGAGLVALVVGGFSYSRRRNTVELGPFKATVRERQHVTIPPLLGAAAVVAGVALIVITSRKSS